MNNQLISKRAKIAETTSKYDDLIGEEAKTFQREYGIESAEKMTQALKTIENSERLLQIGIVGRVKAGKSSLLNALLFDGKPILPKAATPMTAALTVLSYSEVSSAEVEFFSQQDIENIQIEYNEYNHALNKLKDLRYNELEEKKKAELKRAKIDVVFLNQAQKDEIKEKAQRQARRELKENQQLSASYDQYQRMKNSGINLSTLEKSNVILFDSIDDISNELKDYVGADGKYMPFTKSVNIKLPLDFLKDVQIVDTPGLNDPVQSREKRTRELLQFCDVTFIVSSAGQFMNNADIELMDRISTKEGVREIYVLASQIDAQLFASVKRDHKGVLVDVVNGVTSTLGNHLYTTLSQLKKSNPEVGDTFDVLIDNSKANLLYTSGIAQTIQLYFDDLSQLDDGAKKVWDNLKAHYPENFSDDDKALSVSNLKLLGNIATLKDVIIEVREKKDDILNKRKDEFLETKGKALSQYHSALLEYIKIQKEKISTSDIKDIEEEKIALEKVANKVSAALNEEYYQLVQEFHNNMKKELLKILSTNIKDTEDSIASAEGDAREEYYVTNPNDAWYKFWADSKIKKTKNITTIHTGLARSSLRNFISEIENKITAYSTEQEMEWKKKLFLDLVKIIRSFIEDDELDRNIIRSTIRKILNSTIYPETEYDNQLPASLNGRGVLKEKAADDFIYESGEYLSKSKKSINISIKEYCKNLNDILNDINPASEIFGDYKKKIEMLEEQIQYREITLTKMDRLNKELEVI